MAELHPAPFRDLVARLYEEPARQDALFELPRNRWYSPPADGPDLSVRFHDRSAGNPLGPAAGPHTQMAQNILLSYVAGGRILELKTVQVNDRLTIGRPCIDMTNVGYNIEWSQELRVEQSIREYVAGTMLVHMFRFAHPTTVGTPVQRATGDADSARVSWSGGTTDLHGWHGPAGEVIYDLSVGYDLAGIRSPKVRAFLDSMRDASVLIENLRSQIPDSYGRGVDDGGEAAASTGCSQFLAARDLDYPTRLSDSITLSTFHGCPADEIEHICEFLIGECDFDVIVKMNPPMLGQERLEHLLHDVLGYRELKVNPEVYRTGLAFDEGVQLCRRLTSFATARGRRFGAKFSNTLEVMNHREFFTPDNKVMYLSGQPLYVITLALTDEFRGAMGPDFPISFSAGIDAQNFPIAVECGFVPITVSTDLLRPGGYGRMPAYLNRLSMEMRKCDAATIDEYILRRAAQTTTPDRALSRDHEQSRDRKGADTSDVLDPADVLHAALLNTTHAAERARSDPRYRAAQNRKVPVRVDSTLVTFDCLTCDKCLPVCPNAANFTYPTPRVAFDCHDVIVSPDGTWREGECRRFEITETMQIACYADFCNECGNCDTFCPEYGGPYIKKPTFFGSLASWEQAAPRDGFVCQSAPEGAWIKARIQGRNYELSFHMPADEYEFDCDGVRLRIGRLDDESFSVRQLTVPAELTDPQSVSTWVFHVLRHLLDGVGGLNRINQVNARNTITEAPR